jgi:hypothetical protein
VLKQEDYFSFNNQDSEDFEVETVDAELVKLLERKNCNPIVSIY